ncbi:MAG: SpoIIE family protein phosphatase [Spirochaetia bacterium]|nr:SpoIIE family protein phosphatase [Spirochaetia bacterium]
MQDENGNILPRLQSALDAVPARFREDLDFEVDLFLAKLELLAAKARDPDFSQNTDKKRIKENLFEFLRDDLIYLLQKILVDPQAIYAQLPDIVPDHRDLIQILKELHVFTYYPVGKDFRRTSIIEHWFIYLYEQGYLSQDKTLNYFQLYKNRLYSLAEDVPYEFTDITRMVRKMLQGEESPMSFIEIYKAEIMLRNEILFALLRHLSTKNRLEYLISKEILEELSNHFINVLHEEVARQLRESLQELNARHEEVLKVKAVMDTEIRSAQKTQDRFLQKSLPTGDPRINFSLWYDPLLAVGGDVYHVDRISADEYSIFLADISGHGLGAALYFNTIRSSFERHRKYHDRPEKVLRKMNEDLYGKLEGNFVTAVFIYIHLKRKQIKFCNAGHPGPGCVQFDGDRARMRIMRSNSKALGIFERARFYESVLPLAPRNRLIIYTDGVTELADPAGHLLTERRFFTMFRGTEKLSTDEALAAVKVKLTAYQGSAPTEDDRSVIVADIRE